MAKRLVRTRETAGILEMCRKCYSCKQENELDFERPEYFLENEIEEKTIRFIQCPTCSEEPLAMFDMEYV